MTTRRFVALVLALTGATVSLAASDPKVAADKALLAKIKLISPFPTLAMVSKLTDTVCSLGYNGTTVAQAFKNNPDYFMNMALNLVDNKQKVQIVQLINNLQKEFGGVSDSMMSDGMTAAQPLLVLLVDPMSTKMAKDVKKGVAKKKACANAIDTITNMLSKDLFSAVITLAKKAFTPAQCSTFFKYMAPAYLSLGQYSFMNPPCSGKGVCTN